VLLNAGTALHIAGTTPTIADGIRAAAATLDSGAARAKLEELAAAGTAWKSARA
jgi:anthranilate phosphoribosyltransferase